MDYKEKYLRLKNQIALVDNYRRLNAKLINELSNLVFVVGDKMLDESAHVVLLSLVEKFSRISANNDLTDSLELSKYYDIGQGLLTKEGLVQCENCELVLKYFDVPVCISNVNVKTLADQPDKKRVDCQLSRGVVKFYIKQKDGNCYHYTDIRTVKLDVTDSLRPYSNILYQNANEIDKIGDAASVALTKAQNDVIAKLTEDGNLDISSAMGINQSIQAVDDITNTTKNIAATTQLGKMNGQRILSKIPTQTAVDAANVVATNIINTSAASEKNLTAIMVPSNQSIPVQANPQIATVPGSIGRRGILAMQTGGDSTMASTIAGNRASIAVDANIAVVPVANVTSDAAIAVTQPSTHAQTSVQNKLAIKPDILPGDVSQKVQDLTHKMANFFNGENSVVPVSQNLSIMTNLPSTQAANYTPIPQNEVVDTATYSHLENKLVGGTKISLTNSKIATQTIRNGVTNISMVQQNPDINKSSTMNAADLPYQLKTQS